MELPRFRWRGSILEPNPNGRRVTWWSWPAKFGGDSSVGLRGRRVGLRSWHQTWPCSDSGHASAGSSSEPTRLSGHTTEQGYHRPSGECRGSKGHPVNDEMLARMASGEGFIAALDQSGGSTPKALQLYGIEPNSYSGDEEMFALMHAMRTRMMTSPAFDGSRVLGAILFEGTMDRQVEGRGSAEYLWQQKQVVPFLKVDKGLADEADGVQVMKPMPHLDDLLARATAHGVFGTKMRSVIKLANADGVDAVVSQQFEVGRQILAAGLVPIIEPEVDIKSPQKSEAESLLKASLLRHLESIDGTHRVMLKLTLPSTDGFYGELVAHPRVLRVVALSGGYSRDEANDRLRRNHGMIASFSRALTEGLSAQQSDTEFNAALDAAIQSIFDASRA
jgi:fructose-bisphosphate aldolase, class I